MEEPLDYSGLDIPSFESLICFLIIYLGGTTIIWFLTKTIIKYISSIFKDKERRSMNHVD